MLYSVYILIPKHLINNKKEYDLGLGNTNRNCFEKFSYDHFYIFWTNQTLWATTDICKNDDWKQLFYFGDSPHIFRLKQKSKAMSLLQ